MTAAATLETVEGAQVREPGRRHATVPTELGDLTLVAEGDALLGVYFPDHRPAPAANGFGEHVDAIGDPVLEEAARQVVDYASGRQTSFDLPLRAVGSERARKVWDLIAAVPRGETTTYAALARAVGIGPRVAGQLVARNPLSVVVPCHRVVASDGRLTGYAGGVDRKRQLLELEGVLAAAGGAAAPAAAVKAPAEAPVAEPAPALEVDG